MPSSTPPALGPVDCPPSMPDPALVWYHVNLSTYGAWLDGDPRGFRTKNHRKHIEGDYKHPPRPGSYKRRLRRSRELLVQASVVLDQQWRPIIGESLVVALAKLHVETLVIAVGRQHVHLQIRTPFGKARFIAGIAKNDVLHDLRLKGWTGKLWAKRSKAIPIRTREHQLKVFRYILKHEHEGAWVWDWKRGAHEKP